VRLNLDAGQVLTLSIDFMRIPLDTGRMPQLLELVIIAFLVLIAIELLLIYREIMRSQIHRKQLKEDTGSGGQTINVTVGTPSAGQPALVVAKDVAQSKAGESDIVITPLEPEPEAPKPAPPPSTRSTSSGLIAKKCPSCGAENSSYRSECFNCNATL